MTHTVSAVLLNYRRQFHIAEIVESLDRHPFISEVVLFNNGEPDTLIDLVPETKCSVTIMDSRENVCTYGRVLAADLAENDIIYTQDDDVVVENVPELYERFLTHRENITAGLVPRHYELEAHKKPWLQVGWGAFLMRNWLACLEPYIDRFGEDELLHRKCDRIFTALHGKHDPVPANIKRLRNPEGNGNSDRDINSLWLRQDHDRLTAQAMQRVKRLLQEKVPEISS